MLLLTRIAGAQENFEIQVYGAETVAPGRTMIELHSNLTILGTTRAIDGVRPTQHALHETLEVTQGLTPWLETALYLFTSVQLFGVLDLDLGENWEFNVGVGAGLTPVTDSLMVKSIIGYRFDFLGGR